MTKAEWSGWAQAVGSVLAIAFGLFGLRKQLRHAEDLRARDRADRDEAAANLAVQTAKDACEALRFYARVIARAEVGDRKKFGQERFQAVLDVLKTTVNKDLPVGVAPALMRLIREVAYALAAIRQLHNDENGVTLRRVSRAQRREAAALEQLAILTAIHQRLHTRSAD